MMFVDWNDVSWRLVVVVVGVGLFGVQNPRDLIDVGSRVNFGTRPILAWLFLEAKLQIVSRFEARIALIEIS
jgi:hypothetical protein